MSEGLSALLGLAVRSAPSGQSSCRGSEKSFGMHWLFWLCVDDLSVISYKNEGKVTNAYGEPRVINIHAQAELWTF